MMMFTWFSGCYFWVRIFLIILIWICSFGRDNCFYQCVAIVGNQFAFLYCPYKLPTPVFCKLWFRRNLFNKTTLLFYMHLHTYLGSRFHDCKHENTGFRSHIKNITRLLWSLLFLCSSCFPIYLPLHNWQDSKIIILLALLFVNETSFTRLWWYSFDRVYDALVIWIYFLFDWLTWHVDFIKKHLCCGKTLGINHFIQHIVHMVKPMIWFCFISLVLKLKLWLAQTFGPLTIYSMVDWMA